MTIAHKSCAQIASIIVFCFDSKSAKNSSVFSSAIRKSCGGPSKFALLQNLRSLLGVYSRLMHSRDAFSMVYLYLNILRIDLNPKER